MMAVKVPTIEEWKLISLPFLSTLLEEHQSPPLMRTLHASLVHQIKEGNPIQLIHGLSVLSTYPQIVRSQT